MVDLVYESLGFGGYFASVVKLKLFALRVAEFPDAPQFRVEYMVVADIAGHSEISVPTARSILVDKEMTLDLHYEVSGIFFSKSILN